MCSSCSTKQRELPKSEGKGAFQIPKIILCPLEFACDLLVLSRFTGLAPVSSSAAQKKATKVKEGRSERAENAFKGEGRCRCRRRIYTAGRAVCKSIAGVAVQELWNLIKRVARLSMSKKQCKELQFQSALEGLRVKTSTGPTFDPGLRAHKQAYYSILLFYRAEAKGRDAAGVAEKSIRPAGLYATRKPGKMMEILAGAIAGVAAHELWNLIKRVARLTMSERSFNFKERVGIGPGRAGPLRPGPGRPVGPEARPDNVVGPGRAGYRAWPSNMRPGPARFGDESIRVGVGARGGGERGARADAAGPTAAGGGGGGGRSRRGGACRLPFALHGSGHQALPEEEGADQTSERIPLRVQHRLTHGAGRSRGSESVVLTPDELLMLPTGPRQCSPEELERSRLGDGDTGGDRGYVTGEQRGREREREREPTGRGGKGVERDRDRD
ncbi:hypothetical protein EJ110_NYTH54146 [Nymphaea thermarum]|nr:hypothetical protein EJ110_NYTH54146 [Nymphaea thermarum]